MARTPNTYSPTEVRRAFQKIHYDTSILTEGGVGSVLVGAGSGVLPTWTTSLTALTLLTVDNITINTATISSDTGTISFSDDNITTTGTISGVNVTSGANPGHTHTGSSLSGIDISEDTNLAATSPIVLTGDTLSLNQGAIDHGSIGGLTDDDHTQYSLVNGTRAFSSTVGGVTPTDSAHLTTKNYVDTAIAAATPSFTATADATMVAGVALYVVSTGHVDAAFSDGDPQYKVAGLLQSGVTSGDTATVATNGSFTLADWTAIIGAATLTPGEDYYLAKFPSGTPDYGNTGGTGDRTSLITVTADVGHTGNIMHLVNGNLADNDLYLLLGVTGKFIRFDFGSGASYQITEAKWYQSTTATHGTFQWQGSNNPASWTNIGGNFTLGGATTQTQTELSSNTFGYRYYQLLGVSGTASSGPWVNEIEFKIADLAGEVVGQLTTTAPTDAEVVRVGYATSTTTLCIDIDHYLSHGDLTGLADDDHTQYHNDTRGDARYYTETELDAGQLDNRYFTETEHIATSAGAGDAGKPIKLDAGGCVDATMINDADVDHGSIGGLADDDHSQYHTDGRAATWLAANHETTYNHANFVSATSLTATRVAYASAAHTVTDSANLTFDGTTLSTVNVSLPATTTSTAGVLFQSSTRFLHSYSDAGTAGANTFLGKNAGNFTVGAGGSGIDGSINTGIGSDALKALTSGQSNGALGYGAGHAITSGNNNMAFGPYALYLCNTGYSNVAIGVNAGNHITSGFTNVAIGNGALQAVTTAASNIAIGALSGYVATGGGNVFIGAYSGYANVSGSGGVYLGDHAGYYETAGSTLFIDNAARASEADGRAKALIYGLFAASQANQLLAVNGVLEPYGLTAGRVVYSATGTINPKLVDSANLTFDGTYLTTSYKSSDGSAGLTTTFTNGDGATVTVKNGLITGIV